MSFFPWFPFLFSPSFFFFLFSFRFFPLTFSSPSFLLLGRGHNFFICSSSSSFLPKKPSSPSPSPSPFPSPSSSPSLYQFFPLALSSVQLFRKTLIRSSTPLPHHCGILSSSPFSKKKRRRKGGRSRLFGVGCSSSSLVLFLSCIFETILGICFSFLPPLPSLSFSFSFSFSFSVRSH